MSRDRATDTLGVQNHVLQISRVGLRDELGSGCPDPGSLAAERLDRVGFPQGEDRVRRASSEPTD